MTMSKLLFVLLAVALAVTAGAYGVAYWAAARTSPDSATGATPSFGTSLTGYPTTATQIAFWSGRVSEQPKAYLDLTLLGQAFLRKARETSEIDYYVRAETALRRALRINPRYVQAQAVLASVLYSVHEFGQALAAARPIVDQPRGVQALATVGDANMALGRYSRAQSAYMRLFAWAATPAAYSRLSALATLRGNDEQAIALMEHAASLAQQSGDYGESLGWYSYQLGELSFRLGRLDEADSHYRDALRAFPDYPLALAGLAKVRAVRGEHRAAIRLYARATAIVPLPDLLAALGDLYAATGERALARRQFATVQAIARIANAKRQVYNRQLALFYADHRVHLARARQLALRELSARKDVYGYDAAAWALARSGRCEAALPLAVRALRLGTRDPLLFFHRGYTEGCAGNPAAKRAWYARALALNPRFSFRWAPVARAALGGAA
jgi:tetratricopeptide (TPR) repeat protein